MKTFPAIYTVNLPLTKKLCARAEKLKRRGIPEPYIAAEIAIKAPPTIDMMFRNWAIAAHTFSSDPNAPAMFSAMTLDRGGLHLYVRWRKRDVNGKIVQCLDIACVDVPERRQGKGWFKQFVENCRDTPGIDGVYVECVANRWLGAVLERWGFEALEGKNYWRPTTHSSSSENGLFAAPVCEL